MSTAILEKFLLDYVEASEGEAELIDAGTYTVLYGAEPVIKTVTFEIEVAKESNQVELFLPGSQFFDAVIRDAMTNGSTCATYLSGFQTVMKVIQTDSMNTFSFIDQVKDGTKRIKPIIPPFQPYNFRIWTFVFKVRVTTDIIEDHLYPASIDARTLKVVKNFTEYLDKFQHIPRYEETIPDYHPQDFQSCYQSALEYIKQRLTSLIGRKKQETTDLKLKETERIKKYYDTLNEEMEDALERKAGDQEAVAEIRSKQKAVLAQKQSALGDIEFRYKMNAGISLVSVLITNYPCYVSKASIPSTLQPSGYDIIWNPLFKRFEPLVCPTCRNQSYTLNFHRTGVRCQNCFK